MRRATCTRSQAELQLSQSTAEAHSLSYAVIGVLPVLTGASVPPSVLLLSWLSLAAVRMWDELPGDVDQLESRRVCGLPFRALPACRVAAARSHGPHSTPQAGELRSSAACAVRCQRINDAAEIVLCNQSFAVRC